MMIITMGKSGYLLTVLGLVLGAAGLALFNFGGAPEKTAAQTGPYSTTWTATKILTVNATVGGFMVGDAGIGVWEWFVSGSIGSTSFTETWSAPVIGNMSFTPSGRQGCSINSVDESKILAGCFAAQNRIGAGSRASSYDFSVKAVGDYVSNISRLNQGTGTQKTVSCIRSPNDLEDERCLFQSGSYSFQDIYESELAGGPRTGLVGGGTLMPLVWTVTGNIN